MKGPKILLDRYLIVHKLNDEDIFVQPDVTHIRNLSISIIKALIRKLIDWPGIIKHFSSKISMDSTFTNLMQDCYDAVLSQHMKCFLGCTIWPITKTDHLPYYYKAFHGKFRNPTTYSSFNHSLFGWSSSPTFVFESVASIILCLVQVPLQPLFLKSMPTWIFPPPIPNEGQINDHQFFTPDGSRDLFLMTYLSFTT